MFRVKKMTRKNIPEMKENTNTQTALTKITNSKGVRLVGFLTIKISSNFLACSAVRELNSRPFYKLTKLTQKCCDAYHKVPQRCLFVYSSGSQTFYFLVFSMPPDWFSGIYN